MVAVPMSIGTPASAKNFEDRSQCLIDQYSQYQVWGKNVSGNVTLGENIADHGGLNAAWDAYTNHAQPTQPLLSGFTNDQFFFLYYAQGWCGKLTKEAALHKLARDVHSPGRWRVNGPLSNMQQFATAYNCPANSFMGRSMTPAACSVW